LNFKGEEFRKACFKIGEPDQPVPSSDIAFIASNLIPNSSLYDQKLHQVPDLDHFNMTQECPEQEECLYPGGETKALELFKRRMENEKESFERGELNPNLSKPIMLSKEIILSPYFRFGCLSVRKFYWSVKKAYLKVLKLS
jgi:cryptochrome